MITNEFLQTLFVQGGGSSRRYDFPPACPVLLLQSRSTAE